MTGMAKSKWRKTAIDIGMVSGNENENRNGGKL